MKIKLVIAALVVMAAMMISSLSSVMAETANGNFAPGVLMASNNGNVWYFDIKPVSSGKAVVSVVARYWASVPEGQPLGAPITVIPDRISFTDSQIKLFFDTTSLPIDAAKFEVYAYYDSINYFYATGPGWTYIHH
jgi:hypothetical protein